MTSAAAGYYKSRPELYWQTLAALGADPKRSLHIGDSARFDVDGAARAGLSTVWLDHGGSAKPATVPTLTVNSLDGIAPQLLSLLERST